MESECIHLASTSEILSEFIAISSLNFGVGF